MSALSEVSVLIGQRAGDLEKAREVFTAETRAFVSRGRYRQPQHAIDAALSPPRRIDLSS